MAAPTGAGRSTAATNLLSVAGLIPPPERVPVTTEMILICDFWQYGWWFPVILPHEEVH
jgi:hypothetical protein